MKLSKCNWREASVFLLSFLSSRLGLQDAVAETGVPVLRVLKDPPRFHDWTGEPVIAVELDAEPEAAVGALSASAVGRFSDTDDTFPPNRLPADTVTVVGVGVAGVGDVMVAACGSLILSLIADELELDTDHSNETATNAKQKC